MDRTFELFTSPKGSPVHSKDDTLESRRDSIKRGSLDMRGEGREGTGRREGQRDDTDPEECKISIHKAGGL